MRQVLMALAIVASVCCFPSGVRAETQAPPPSPLDSCLNAAGASRVQMEACRGIMAEPCMETDAGATTYGMVQCFGAETSAWRTLLDDALARAMTHAERAPLLAHAQEAWIAWRDAECGYQASLYAGGSLARVLAASCINDLTASRAIDLIYAEREPN